MKIWLCLHPKNIADAEFWGDILYGILSADMKSYLYIIIINSIFGSDDI